MFFAVRFLAYIPLECRFSARIPTTPLYIATTSTGMIRSVAEFRSHNKMRVAESNPLCVYSIARPFHNSGRPMTHRPRKIRFVVDRTHIESPYKSTVKRTTAMGRSSMHTPKDMHRAKTSRIEIIFSRFYLLNYIFYRFFNLDMCVCPTPLLSNLRQIGWLTRFYRSFRNYSLFP